MHLPRQPNNTLYSFPNIPIHVLMNRTAVSLAAGNDSGNDKPVMLVTKDREKEKKVCVGEEG